MIASQIATDSTRSRSRTPENILLLMPNRLQQQRLTECLAAQYTLFFARNKRETLKALEDHPVDLILIDHPSAAEGIDICTMLKASSQYFHLPIILLHTGKNPKLRIDFLNSGVDIVLEKRFSRSHLQAQVRNLLNNRLRIKQYYTEAHAVAESSITPHSARIPTENTLSHRLDKIIEENLSNPKLDIPFLARQLNMSRATFYRQCNTITGNSPNERITTTRLNKAAELITTTNYTISEITNRVGFTSRSNFGKAFYKRYQLTPTDYKCQALEVKAPY